MGLGHIGLWIHTFSGSNCMESYGVWMVTGVENDAVRGNVSWHAAINRAVDVIPFQGDAPVHVASPILFDCVMPFECIYQVFGIVLTGVFDAKIVKDLG
jgi:hypothetical protein